MEQTRGSARRPLFANRLESIPDRPIFVNDLQRRCRQERLQTRGVSRRGSSLHYAVLDARLAGSESNNLLAARFYTELLRCYGTVAALSLELTLSRLAASTARAT
jgi:hypothetical protein